MHTYNGAELDPYVRQSKVSSVSAGLMESSPQSLKAKLALDVDAKDGTDIMLEGSDTTLEDVARLACRESDETLLDPSDLLVPLTTSSESVLRTFLSFGNSKNALLVFFFIAKL